MLREIGSAEPLCVLCQHNAYCSSRLNVNMHLLISPAQKKDSVWLKMYKNSKMHSEYDANLG